jgi:hypothetical protein
MQEKLRLSGLSVQELQIIAAAQRRLIRRRRVRGIPRDPRSTANLLTVQRALRGAAR